MSVLLNWIGVYVVLDSEVDVEICEYDCGVFFGYC